MTRAEIFAAIAEWEIALDNSKGTYIQLLLDFPDSSLLPFVRERINTNIEHIYYLISKL